MTDFDYSQPAEHTGRGHGQARGQASGQANWEQGTQDSPEEMLIYTRPGQILSLNAWLFSGILTLTVLLEGRAFLDLMNNYLNINMQWYWVVGAFAAGFIPGIYKSLTIHTTEYMITNHRLKLRHGIFNKHTDEIEVHRIRDFVVKEPFSLRMFNRGNVVILSCDKSVPEATLDAVLEPQDMRNEIRQITRARQMELGWVETEVT